LLPNQYIKGGILWETIYGIECRTPLIPKDLTKVRNYGLPKKEQVYSIANKVHLNTPDYMKILEKERDKDGNVIRILYTQKQLEYIETELDKIYGKDDGDGDEHGDIGDWIYIGGNLTWICPWHYLLLEYWEITKASTADKRAEYRDAQRRDILYYWNCFKHDPQCLGPVKMKNRQDLATTLAQVMTFWFATRKEDQVAGQMADADQNTTANFQQLLLVPFKRLVDWLQPKHVSSEKSETLELREPPQRQSANNRVVRESIALNSVCNTRAGSVKGYDSQRPDFLFIDEAGKMDRFSVYTMLSNQKPFIQRGAFRTGFCAVFTTVNEMNKGGAEFQKFWKDSNPKEIGKNGQTKSGWKRLYRSSDDGLEGFVGRYGESIRDKPNNDQWEFLQTVSLKGEDGKPIPRERIGAREFIERNRADLADDETRLWNYIRNFSLSEDECFTSQNVDCHFTLTTLNNQIKAIDHAEEIAPLWTRGNFRFRDMEKMDCVFEPDRPGDVPGRFSLAWIPPNKELQNMVRMGAKGIEPLNKRVGVIGVDPFSKSGTEGSHGAACGRLFFNYATEIANIEHRKKTGEDMPGYYPSHSTFLMYHARPQSVTVFHEDILMACHFYGMKMAFESNVDKIEAHFKSRGYSEFILSKGELKKSLPTLKDYEQSGIPMTADLKQHGVDCMEMFFAGDAPYLRGLHYKLSDDVRRHPFRIMLQDHILFKMKDSQIYDLTMACIIAFAAEWSLCDYSDPNFNVAPTEASNILPDYIISEMGWDLFDEVA